MVVMERTRCCTMPCSCTFAAQHKHMGSRPNILGADGYAHPIAVNHLCCLCRPQVACPKAKRRRPRLRQLQPASRLQLRLGRAA